MRVWMLSLFSLLSLLRAYAQGEQCGSQAGGKLCPGGLCCSRFGFCGTTSDYCGTGCQSQCSATPNPTPTPTPTPSGGGDLSSVLSRAQFEQMLKHRNDAACEGKGFYTYDAFVSAAKSFGAFGNTGDAATRKREVAAFLAQTSHETTGGWPTAPDGPFAWGYCFLREQGNPGDYCVANQQWPCAAGKKYFGRGRAIGFDLLGNPDVVATDPIISFKTALWFWMTPQSPKPSCHDVITGRWTPSGADTSAGRVPGYGVITNIINGGLECGKGSNPQADNRVGFYKRYCDILGIGYGNNLDCNNQRPFA
ncbi:basic chitinase [Actinidia rufa]|uniref:Basic chitinase n=1 Tax=Actinidia rufa TaxID=165716 RepID=A0A7J0GF52_9ERIC|nr:basic chitinase [Actinidia rufa]